jgi:hypothetical protein
MRPTRLVADPEGAQDIMRVFAISGMTLAADKKINFRLR